jgi:hypothetical protein
MTDINPELVQTMHPEDPELAADVDCAGDVEQHIGEPVDDSDDEVEAAIDAFLAEDEDDLDGDGLPDPPDDGEDGA